MRNTCSRILVVADEHLGRYDQKRLRNGNPKSLRSASQGSISIGYGLVHGHEWICAPQGQSKNQLIPKELTLCKDVKKAWFADTMDLAIERSKLLLNGWGYHTEVRVIRAK